MAKSYSDRRPVLLDRRLRRHDQAVGGGAVERLAVLVADHQQVELTRARMLDAGEREVVNGPARIDRVDVGLRIARLHALT